MCLFNMLNYYLALLASFTLRTVTGERKTKSVSRFHISVDDGVEQFDLI